MTATKTAERTRTRRLAAVPAQPKTAPKTAPKSQPAAKPEPKSSPEYAGLTMATPRLQPAKRAAKPVKPPVANRKRDVGTAAIRVLADFAATLSVADEKFWVASWANYISGDWDARLGERSGAGGRGASKRRDDAAH